MLIFLFLIVVLLWSAYTLKIYKNRNIRLFKILLAVPLALLILMSIAIGNMIEHYPISWRNINLKEKRFKLHGKLGAPTVGLFWDVKSDLWIQNHFFCWHRLEVYYNSDTIAHDYTITFYIGTKEYFKSYNIASSFDTKSTQK